MKMKYWISTTLALASILAAGVAHAGYWMKCGTPKPDGSVGYTDIACPKAASVKPQNAEVDLTILEGKELKSHVLAEVGDADVMSGLLKRLGGVVSDSEAQASADKDQSYSVVVRDANGMLLRRWITPRDPSVIERLVNVFTGASAAGASVASSEGAEPVGEAAEEIKVCTRCLYCEYCGYVSCWDCTCQECPKPAN